RQTGELAHALLARVLDPAEPAAMRAWFQQQHPRPTAEARAALAEVEACLKERALRALLSPGVCRVWRERRFEIILDDEWITGVFDRVHLAEGRARLLDFKTDAVTATEAKER